MKDIAIAIMVVGLCFYTVYRYKVLGREDTDPIASLIAFIGAIILLI